MADDKRITELTELTTPAEDDYIEILDTSENDIDEKNKKLKYANLGHQRTVLTEATHGFAVGDAVGHDGANWVKAIASLAAGIECIGVVVDVTDANTFTLVTQGWVTVTTHGITVGKNYLSATVAGGLTTTALPGTKIQVVAKVIDADNFIVQIGGSAP
jgi:hypothetical protein